MDHVSDSFLETNVPLLVLIEAAKNGNEKEVKEYAQVFREHANKLIEVMQIFQFSQSKLIQVFKKKKSNNKNNLLFSFLGYTTIPRTF